MSALPRGLSIRRIAPGEAGDGGIAALITVGVPSPRVRVIGGLVRTIRDGTEAPRPPEALESKPR